MAVASSALCSRVTFAPGCDSLATGAAVGRRPGGGRIHSKPRQAQAMISRALAAGAPFAWFTADETCGQAKWLQAWLEDQDVC